MAFPFIEKNPLLNALYGWLDRRFFITDALKFALKKEVPVHKHSIWYYMGGVAMLFVMVQLLTGLLLMLYYVPTYEGAYNSVMKLMNEVEFGALIRSMHSWGANLFILVLFFHMFSTYFMKAYRAPREFTWLTGLGLLGLAMVFGFTGYLLPMDQIAFFATKVGIDVASKAPIVGELVAFIARGGDEIGQGTLNRFFTIHVIALPAALLGLLGLHLMLIQLHGISVPPGIEKKAKEKPIETEKFFPDFILKDVLVWATAFFGFMVICCTMPWGLGAQPDPAAPAPLGIKPEWYFLSQFQVLKEFPAHVLCLSSTQKLFGVIPLYIEGEHFAMGLIGVVAGSLALVPFIDTGKNELVSKLTTAWGLFVLGAIIFTTIVAELGLTPFYPIVDATLGRCLLP
jgi:quinol-cytochrome oxidoreductase complex cytochrome b subunit